MIEIRPKQRWIEGLEEVEVSKVFGVRIEVCKLGSNAVEHVVEKDFRKRFTYVSG